MAIRIVKDWHHVIVVEPVNAVGKWDTTVIADCPGSVPLNVSGPRRIVSASRTSVFFDCPAMDYAVIEDFDFLVPNNLKESIPCL